jgi:hypothetical protein
MFCRLIFASFHQGKEENMFCFLYLFQVLKKAQGSQRSGAVSTVIPVRRIITCPE